MDINSFKMRNNKINQNDIKYTPNLVISDDIPEVKFFCYLFWEDEGIYSDNFYELILKQKLSYSYKENNNIIALCLISYEEEINQVNISVLCVDKEYQRKGLGHSLLFFCIDNCINQGYRFFYLHVSVPNKTAIRLYEKIGFFISEYVPNYYIEEKYPDSDAYLMCLIISDEKREIKEKIKDETEKIKIELNNNNDNSLLKKSNNTLEYINYDYHDDDYNDYSCYLIFIIGIIVGMFFIIIFLS